MAVRTDLTLLLGRHLGDYLTQEVLREWALLPGLGAGPARSLLSPDLGVSLLADDYGRIAMIFLHFHGDAGFQPYPGAIPGRGGTIPKRNSLMAALGRPDPGTTGQWSFPTFTMFAQYAADNENLLRLTLRAA
ncbi:hypothetical protein Ate02nite_31750 [Paractinoplanes tereljensis]|uniref:Uncharacterized protein n=1 Tax=Paractinoplanes tereljensis TaxID=571912 RepID=A0A919NLQ5_9ACTN|nr:hypothetical protein Ate02nite_31750 [Actinoplanes tereljensis]